MTKKRIGIYLLITFGLVWGITIGYLLCGGSYEDSAMQFILMFSMLCPSIAALVTRKITKEGFAVTGRDSLMLGIDLKNKKWIWFVLAFFMPVLYSDFGILIYYVIFPEAFDPGMLDMIEIPRSMLFLVPVAGITYSALLCSFGALGEEIGWRSYLYPKLEELFGTNKAVLFGGIIWGLWHFPAIYAGHNFGHGYFGEPWTGFVVFTIFTIVIGSILFYLTKKTGSVWAAAFMHAANNVFFGGGTILGMTYSDENLSGIGLEAPLRLLIMSIPVIAAGIFTWRMMLKEKKGCFGALYLH